ncbi:hypothetical protein XPR_1299 [Xanthomonas arboricola pv. pruni MAFF 301420]|uniref:Transposase InsH N-terminal domain-containing protein n=1 Tax=Xanthomonas arboricola pv. pruni MAFF 301420 TaxID=1418095 RepID=W4SFE7_9XANT|nr:hypothetical protein XPR_1299 [Xanthomonas arboricola pv. pruni MAFF 301420]
MRTRRPAAEQLPSDELFRSRLENQIDLRHPLVQLSHRLPWRALEQALSPQLPVTTGTGGRPALPLRLIAGLLYLKQKTKASRRHRQLFAPRIRDWEDRHPLMRSWNDKHT